MSRQDILPGVSRRDWLKLAAAGVLGSGVSPWFSTLAAEAARNPQRKRACILLWMNGGPSQMDTFDLKPGHENGGPFKTIQTSAPGLHISEHLPKLAKFGNQLAVMRGMSTKEADHSRATYLMRTGQAPTGPIQYPPIGSLVAKELGAVDAALPSYISIAPYRFFNPAAFLPGFLGPMYAPLVVGEAGNFRQQGNQAIDYASVMKVQDIDRPADVTAEQSAARIDLLADMDAQFVAGRPSHSVASHQSAYERAVRLARGEATKAFDLEEEKAELRDRYGRNLFGQGCLLARRLVERGVPFVEVTLAGVNNQQAFGWDTHAQNFTAVQRLSEVLDPAWATLMEDLKERGLLETTTILWMGEFGRTPKINRGTGRDHFPNAWTTVLAGGGIQGGQAHGKTSADGMTVEEGQTSVGDLLATLCKALGIDPEKQNNSNIGRPISIVDKNAIAVQEVLR
jgi:uncharacterized protein (DUF1501 family)